MFCNRKQNRRIKKQRWLSDESRRIRKDLKAAERNLPASRNIVQELRCMYRKQVKIDRQKMLNETRTRIKVSQPVPEGTSARSSGL